MLDSEVVLNERYRLDERIATGGMGDVWRATDLVLGRRVAVKVLLPSLLTDPDFLTRFRAEARMMAALRHPGIVQVYDTGEDTTAGGVRAVYLVMEYVDGEPLSVRINADGRLGAAETMAIVAQVADALHAAHGRGIVHRDVKPSNLLVQSDGTVVLVDFGVARSTAVTSITSPNAVPGTALYMAPEQASGRPVSAATDVYALGVVAYHCVAGRTPFTGDNALEVAVKHLDEEVPPLPADVPRPAAEVIERALAKDPAGRFPTASAFAAAARSVAAAGPDAVGPAGGPGQGRADDSATVPLPAGAAGAAAGAGAAGGVAGAAGITAPRGPRTLPDQPVVAAGGDPAGSRWRAPLLGVAGAVLLAALGLAAMLAFGPDDEAPGNLPTLITPSVVPSDALDPAQTGSASPSHDGSTSRPNRPTPTQSAQPSASPPEQGEEPQPTQEPTPPPPTEQEPEPTNQVTDPAVPTPAVTP